MKPKKWYGGKCSSCRRMNQPYMIQEELWKQIKKPREMYLCLYCVESRLGRKLEDEDFIDAPINNGYFGFISELWVDRIYQRAFGGEK